MVKDKKLLYLLKFVLSMILFCGAVSFESAQQQRFYLLVIVFTVFLANGFFRYIKKQDTVAFYLSFYFDIALVFFLEQNSRLLINYFFHSFYIIILLEAALSLSLRKGIFIGAVAVLVSLIKYGYLIYYKFNFANVSQMAFFLMVSVLILVIAGFAQHNREERLRKDILYKELLDMHRQLKQYTDEVNRLSVVEERNRIARDIHDSLGHNMTALIMQLQMTEHLFREDASRAQELLSNAVNTAKESLSGIREVVETLRGTEVPYRSAEALSRLVLEFAQKTGADIKLERTNQNQKESENQTDSGMVKEANIPDSTANMALYRIVQEAMTNAVRHGKATEISVKVAYSAKAIHFRVSDNGIGALALTEGYGLKGIRERVEAFGGEVEYLSESGFSVKGVLYLEENND